MFSALVFVVADVVLAAGVGGVTAVVVLLVVAFFWLIFSRFLEFYTSFDNKAKNEVVE